MNRDFGRTGTGRDVDGGRAPGVSERSVDEVCGLLSDEWRRQVCVLLRARPEWTLEEMAATVAAGEPEPSGGDGPAERRERVQLSLYHVHLPKLADAGVLRFDRAAGRVTRAGGAERVFEVLDAVAAQPAD